MARRRRSYRRYTGRRAKKYGIPAIALITAIGMFVAVKNEKVRGWIEGFGGDQ
jgi:hypothetical protein